MSRPSHRALPRTGSRGRRVLTLGLTAVVTTSVLLVVNESVDAVGTDAGSAQAGLSSITIRHLEATRTAAADPEVPATDAVGAAEDVVPAPVVSPEQLRREREQARKAELARQAERAARRAAQERRDRRARERRLEQQRLSAPVSIDIGSFNVLGSQHTAPGGERRNFPPASVRSAAAANLIAKHGVDIVGTQELQADQLNALQSRTGMAAYPGYEWGEAETDNSVLYDPSLYEIVSGSQFTITFMGRDRPQPIVRLRDKATGREFYVVNTHPSAGGGRYLAERRRGQEILVGIVDELESTGLTVLVTGDMNDREDFYCRVVSTAGLSAPNGGAYGDGCSPPPGPLPVDWVVGSPDVSWSDYWRDTSPVTNRTSDHFFISASATLG